MCGLHRGERLIDPKMASRHPKCQLAQVDRIATSRQQNCPVSGGRWEPGVGVAICGKTCLIFVYFQHPNYHLHGNFGL